MLAPQWALPWGAAPLGGDRAVAAWEDARRRRRSKRVREDREAIAAIAKRDPVEDPSA